MAALCEQPAQSADRETLTPMTHGESLAPVEQGLRVGIAEIAERYRAVLPVEVIAEMVQATWQAMATELAGTGKLTTAEAVIARTKADLAIVVGAPVEQRYPATTGLASAWTHVMDGIAVVRAIGEFDLSTAQVLREELARALRSGQQTVLVDLGRVVFMDLVGLAPLREAAHTAAGNDCRVFLMRVPATVDRMIRLSGIAADLYPGYQPPAPAQLGGEAHRGLH